MTKEIGKVCSYRLAKTSRTDGPTRLVPLLGQVSSGPLDLATEECKNYILIKS